HSDARVDQPVQCRTVARLHRVAENAEGIALTQTSASCDFEAIAGFRSASRPPESGGQRDRDAVEITREEVPKPHSDKVWFGNLPSRDPSGRAALLTQEGVERSARE